MTRLICTAILKREDSVLVEFLAFLSRDIEAHPDRLKTLDGSLREHIQAVLGHVEANLDKALSPEDE